MDSQGQPRHPPTCNPNLANAANEFNAVRPGMPQIPFFQGFPAMGNQMPYLIPHPFIPASSPPTFTSPTCAIPNPTIDLTEDSHKRPSQESVVEKPKPAKKKRVIRKKSEIVDLVDTKDDVDLMKTGGHWKDHWVIQLITIRGEMQNTFSAPPKQGFHFPSLIFFLWFFSGGGLGFLTTGRETAEFLYGSYINPAQATIRLQTFIYITFENILGGMHGVGAFREDFMHSRSICYLSLPIECIRL